MFARWPTLNHDMSTVGSVLQISVTTVVINKHNFVQKRYFLGVSVRKICLTDQNRPFSLQDGRRSCTDAMAGTACFRSAGTARFCDRTHWRTFSHRGIY